MNMRSVNMSALTLTLLMGCAASRAWAAARPVKAKSGASNQCRTLASAIDGSVKEMSQLYADRLNDNSAPRETMRATQIASQQSEIQNHILLMAANRCAPYARSISQSTYLVPALGCVLAKVKEQTAALDEQNRAAEARLGIQNITAPS